MSPGSAPDCANCERLPIVMSLMIQFAAEPDPPMSADDTNTRSGRNATRCGREVICAVDAMGTGVVPVFIGRTWRFAMSGLGHVAQVRARRQPRHALGAHQRRTRGRAHQRLDADERHAGVATIPLHPLRSWWW